jgi:hypothetical protein
MTFTPLSWAASVSIGVNVTFVDSSVQVTVSDDVNLVGGVNSEVGYIVRKASPPAEVISCSNLLIEGSCGNELLGGDNTGTSRQLVASDDLASIAEGFNVDVIFY